MLNLTFAALLQNHKYFVKDISVRTAPFSMTKSAGVVYLPILSWIQLVFRQNVEHHVSLGRLLSFLVVIVQPYTSNPLHNAKYALMPV